MKKLIIALSLIFTGLTASALTPREELAADPNKTGAVYFAYPQTDADNTPAPKGFKPFHFSHYGRHGSRYLIGDNDYRWIADLLHKADRENALTAEGRDLMTRLDSLMVETAGRGGDLSPLGRRQHRGIAERAYRNYPEIFADNSRITARSTLVPRCILSMASFTERLKEQNPRLVIDMESSNRYMPYLCHSTRESDEFNSDRGWWNEVYRKFEREKVDGSRIVGEIFNNKQFAERYVDPDKFLWGVYWLASDAQNTEGLIDFYKFLTPDELLGMYECFNARFYAQHANYAPAEGKHLKNADNLLTNIIETADAAIAESNPSAALRFGHDGNVVPLVARMHIAGCDTVIADQHDFYKGWNSWQVTPMGANIQIVFYRNPKQPDRILAKVLHNEREVRINGVKTDIWPYYDWADLRQFWLRDM